MRILVVGGAGYIGSHMLSVLDETTHEFVTLDNLIKGHRDAVMFGDFIESDLSDKYALDRIMKDGEFDAVIHFSSLSSVEESVLKPMEYYSNNVINTIHLLNSMVRNNVNYIVFSSSAAVYGKPNFIPISEHHATSPINPYGQTKLIIEKLLDDYCRAYGLRSVCLRYFNVAGAHPDGILGERHDPETHLIPLALQVASGVKKHISIFGRNHETNDGTCIRDYVHVMDLCEAHLLALHQLVKQKNSMVYNLGSEQGFSVQEVIDAVSHVTGCTIKTIDKPARLGDAPILIASSNMAKRSLGWKPRYNDLNTMIKHAWMWEKR